MLFSVQQNYTPGSGSFWMPPPGSAGAHEVDWLVRVLLYVCTFFFLLITSLLVTFVIRYRRSRVAGPQPSASHSLPLELAWSIIPLAILMMFFYFGFRGFINSMTPPDDAYSIQVTGQKWAWLFTYPNGYVDKDLHVPVDTAVKLTLTSEDVIHSLFIPAFRLKRDALPGRYTTTWFQADRTGTFDLFCTEYCGEGHSAMLAKVIVHDKVEYKKWLEDAGAFIDRMPPAQAGARLFQTQGCAQCHSVDGSGGIGPSLKNVYSTQQPMKGGGSVLADEDYLRESIMDPQAIIVAGFEPVMPTYKGRLKDKEITVLIAYIKSISKAGQNELEFDAGAGKDRKEDAAK
jgi:cytochrome c oxidase subunit 2